MVQYLFVVVYLGGQVAGSIGPLAELPEKECQQMVARAQVSQTMNGGQMAHFACEWHEHRPRVTVEVR